MFNKALASLGVGAARVDTRLEKSTYRHGEMIRGKVFIQGGQSEQLIDEIYLYLIVQYFHKGTQHDYMVSEYRLTDAFVIGPHENKEFPFQFELPFDAPATTGGASAFLKTGLDIKMAVDPTDSDGIDILPHPLIDKIIVATEQVGFQLYQVDFETETYYSRHPFVQVYRLAPTGNFQSSIDELEMVFFPQLHEVEVIIKVYHKAVDLMSAMEEEFDLDGRLTRLNVTKQEIEKGVEALSAKIEKLIKKTYSK